MTPRPCSTPYSSSPKSSPTGPTTRTSVKNDEASEKWTAEPPSIFSRLPNGVLTASNAIEPTTVTGMRRRRVLGARSAGVREVHRPAAVAGPAHLAAVVQREAHPHFQAAGRSPGDLELVADLRDQRKAESQA